MNNKLISFIVIFATMAIILILFLGCSYLFSVTILTTHIYSAIISVAVLFIIERILNIVI
ncbi:hypothetical protein [Intestinibacter bartlettii]|uniref:Uncharacterized protein n=1 Tax=Intestinibacter bartlettii TaxID=261299 RepID=A0ABS6DW04_9FIRM|nr:hypothetical protein [Intestinibacter bartlettii]MBU5336025.1 hypothetical protein [Intestinibacter bartlettii]MDO5010092.1 hypothetical protein [Intestinibacter bartlettii]